MTPLKHTLHALTALTVCDESRLSVDVMTIAMADRASAKSLSQTSAKERFL